MTAERNAQTTVTTDGRTRDAGFTLTELIIVVFILGLIVPVIAGALVVVIKTTPTNEDRTDDARSLLNLTNWLSQDVASTSEDGFFIGATDPAGGCLDTSLPAGSINLLELHWNEGAEEYVSNYRWVPAGPTTGEIFRYACQQGEAATERRMTPELNSISTGDFAPAPVEITPTPTTLADGTTPGIKGLQFVVLIYDEWGVQRELLSLDATTTNVVTTLPGETPGSSETNLPPTASDLWMTITPPATQVETLPAIDPNAGDVLFTTFPNGVPPAWDIRAVGVTLEVTPDPDADPGDYDITYRVTDPNGEWAQAILKVTIQAPTPNQPPIANAVSITASKGTPSVATLVYSDPEGDPLTPVLETSDIPLGWSATVSGNQVTVTPSATASGTTVIRYSVTDSAGATTTSQITVNVCTVSLRSVTPNPPTVAVKTNGDLFDPVTVEIQSNGACSPLVLGFLPNDTSVVEAAVSFNASNVATIPKNSAFAWTRPGVGETRVVTLNVRQGANGPAELSVDLTTTR